MVYGLRKGAGYNYAGVVGECQMPFECIDLFAFWFCSHSAVLFGKFVAPDAMVIEKNAVERKSQRLQCPFPDSRLQLAFPYVMQCHPIVASLRWSSMSRLRLRSIFAFQNSVLLFGIT